MDLLTNIHIIMVNTTLPANIGSAARAMMTAGLSNLRLVAPKHPIDDTSYAYAKGGKIILDNTKQFDTLHQAICDCNLVFASSARNRHLPRATISPSVASQIIYDFLINQPDTPTIGILFGREDRGLTNDELACADFHIQIPANTAYPVLNIASSIQVIASTLFAYIENTSNTQNIRHSPQQLDIIIRQLWDEPAIDKAMQHKLNQAIIELMQSLDLTQNNLKDLPNRLNRLSSRLQLDIKEYALLMTIIHKLIKNKHTHLS